ncbi:hypothetical protein DPMN_033014 [Dreissena polymorpha]|uniref:Uncharacterized protein n=1 Tax=Dreissena polymorpha TaxID=45954 RepID=A0A9D4M437_DREPO|nr:hypothetical protein DPMN_033014 [Dreissena polymorpha]
MNPDQVLTVKKKSEYNVKISSDISQTCFVSGMCSLPSSHVILADNLNGNVKLLDQHYNASSHCDVSSPVASPTDICRVTLSEVAVSFGKKSVSLSNGSVQFISVSNGQLITLRTYWDTPDFYMRIQKKKTQVNGWLTYMNNQNIENIVNTCILHYLNIEYNH